MFTGIIQTLGTVTTCNPLLSNGQQGDISGGLSLVVAVSNAWLANDPMVIGESIAINGVCTTVTDFFAATEDTTGFTVDLSPETLAVTTLGGLTAGSAVNLERAMRANDRFGGHWVTGHVDSTATYIDYQSDGSSHRLYFRLNNPALAQYLLTKGSITINGISLTLNNVAGAVFDVAIIPHTWEVTTIGQWQLDDTVNIECDHLVKIVSQLHAPYVGQGTTIEDSKTVASTDIKPVSEAFYPDKLGSSHIHTGRWFNLQ